MSKRNEANLSRREFIRTSAAGVTSISMLNFGILDSFGSEKTTSVAIVKTGDRNEGVKKSLELLKFASPKAKKVMIKPNFNTADQSPGSTHNDTLSRLIEELYERDAKEIAIGERSGPPVTKKVMEEKGIFDLAEDLKCTVINYEEIPDDDWVHCNPAGNHWSNGFYVPRYAKQAEYFVSTCCLKTHQYGGVFTMSLKLAVGLTPKKLMRELHSHSGDDMRFMIAEINTGYKPDLIVLDGIEAFVDGGPSSGTRKKANVFIAGTDRIAVDAAGIAVLKELGSKYEIMDKKIFEQEQIHRAVELGLGIGKPEQIEFVTGDEPSKLYAEKLKSILARG